MALRFYCTLLSKFDVAHVAASKGKRCTQDMKIRGFALYTDRGRRLNAHGILIFHPFCSIS